MADSVGENVWVGWKTGERRRDGMDADSMRKEYEFWKNIVR